MPTFITYNHDYVRSFRHCFRIVLKIKLINLVIVQIPFKIERFPLRGFCVDPTTCWIPRPLAERPITKRSHYDNDGQLSVKRSDSPTAETAAPKSTTAAQKPPQLKYIVIVVLDSSRA